MTDSLTPAQLDELKHLLRKRFKTLRGEIRDELLQSDDEYYVQVAGKVHDSGDESVADLLTDINFKVIDNHIKEIQSVEQALLRVSGGSYGRCLDCNEPIAFERLQAEPVAQRCMACQETHDRLYAK